MTAWRCPWCSALRRADKTIRDHVAMNECAQVPLDARIAMIVERADSYSEADWEYTLIDAYRQGGYQCFHIPPMRGRDGQWFTNTTEAGLPDWILVKPPDLILLELKKQTGKATVEQVRTIKRLQQCTNIIAGFGRPTDAPVLMRRALDDAQTA